MKPLPAEARAYGISSRRTELKGNLSIDISSMGKRDSLVRIDAATSFGVFRASGVHFFVQPARDEHENRSHQLWRSQGKEGKLKELQPLRVLHLHRSQT